ncbi:hypothetical protein GQ55_2G372300 [Panicum hallii var. hallii]|uniref:Uncharacterized protein n=1 Tax=Panicum hallii var. hallii TaxID=1504633 RepID=A0A2T7EWG3_9POAL|nr:hypothetical protein GQ55_2G372300 [Panicum hallii var. hallii]
MRAPPHPTDRQAPSPPAPSMFAPAPLPTPHPTRSTYPPLLELGRGSLDSQCRQPDLLTSRPDSRLLRRISPTPAMIRPAPATPHSRQPPMAPLEHGGTQGLRADGVAQALPPLCPSVPTACIRCKRLGHCHLEKVGHTPHTSYMRSSHLAMGGSARDQEEGERWGTRGGPREAGQEEDDGDGCDWV